MVRRCPWYWLAPVLLALALYAVTVPGTYIYDDLLVARDDTRLHDPHKWVDYLRQGYFEDSIDSLWRPLVSLTFAVEAWGHGDRAWPFHLINVLLHATASGLVAVLGARLVDRRVGLLAGLLFAAHPLHVEAVAGIVGRSELMLTIGVLAALIVFIGKPLTIPRALGVAAWFWFAALSKEQGLLLPLMLLAWAMVRRWPRDDEMPALVQTGNAGVLDYASAPRIRRPMTPHRRASLVLTFLLLITLAAYVSYRDKFAKWYWERNFLDPAINPLIASRGTDRWLILVDIVGRYAALLAAPYRLAIDYSASVFTSKLDLHEPYFYIGCIALAAAIILGIIAWRWRWPVVFFCLIALALSYILVSNIMLIGTIFAERLMYLPSVFVCILAAMLLARLRPSTRIALTFSLLLLATLRTVTYGYQWNDRMRLYSYELRQQPKGSMINLLLAGEYSDHGDIQTADRILEKARMACPQAWQVWYRSALIKIKLGDLEAAERFAYKSLRIRPTGSIVETLRKISELQAQQVTTKPATTKPLTR